MKITNRKVASPAGEVTLFRIENKSGAAVELSNLGAGITLVEVPDREGRLANVALSYADPADYLNDGPCMGKIPGRYANRIAKGHLEIDGKHYQLNINNGPNALHGGPTGFQNRLWDAEQLEDGIRFRYVSADGEENYPGRLIVTAEYRWSEDNKLSLVITAETDAPTVVNLTNHTYWNLDGSESGSVLNHEMKMAASRYLATDDTLIPTTIDSVEDTPMDFRQWKKLGQDIKADFPAINYGKGYDACWAIDGWQEGKVCEDAVVIKAPRSGRVMTVSTDQPGVQVYTGNWLAGSPKGRDGREFEDYDGVAVEAQGFPDAPNRKDFPSQELRPGETYRRMISFRFTQA